jgi:hypothetical protein
MAARASVSRRAGPPVRTADQFSGPCYVLSVKDFKHGVRTVVAELPAIAPSRKRRRKLIVPVQPAFTPKPSAAGVDWPKGRPLDWELVARPIEPDWHTRARDLRAQGLSVREIMRALGLKNRRAVDMALARG